MKKKISNTLIYCAIGISLAILSAKFLFVNSWLSLFPWGLGAIIIGLVSLHKKDVIINVSCYSASLVITYLILIHERPWNYETLGYFLIIIIFSLLGMLCANIAALLSYLLKFYYFKVKS